MVSFDDCIIFTKIPPTETIYLAVNLIFENNSSLKITKSELSAWIQLKVKEHFEEAKHETDDVFKHLDSNQDGNKPLIISLIKTVLKHCKCLC